MEEDGGRWSGDEIKEMEGDGVGRMKREMECGDGGRWREMKLRRWRGISSEDEAGMNGVWSGDGGRWIGDGRRQRGWMKREMGEEGDGVGRMKREMGCGDGGRWSGDGRRQRGWMKREMGWEG